MSKAIALRDVHHVSSKLMRMRSQLRAAREKTEEVVNAVVDSALTGASSFGFGYLYGLYGEEKEIATIPVSLGTGVGLHLLGFLGVGGSYQDKLHALGDGALGAFLARLGLKTGVQWKLEEMGATPPKTQGSFPGVQQHYARTAMSEEAEEEEVEEGKI